MADFGRYASVVFGDNEKTFEHGPASLLTVEFEVRHQFQTFRSVSLRLVNPNDDTIAKCEPKQVDEKTTPQTIALTAGYLESQDREKISGVIKSFEVEKSGAERILKIEMTELPKWNPDAINKVAQNLDTEFKLTAFIKGLTIREDLADAPIAEVVFGEFKAIKKILVSAEKPLKAVENIAKQTRSLFYFRNGRLHLAPEDLPASDDEAIINKQNGMLETPKRFLIPKKRKKKGDELAPDVGYIVRTIYKPLLTVGHTVAFEATIGAGKQTLRGVIIESDKAFSTYGEASSTFKVKAA